MGYGTQRAIANLMKEFEHSVPEVRIGSDEPGVPYLVFPMPAGYEGWVDFRAGEYTAFISRRTAPKQVWHMAVGSRLTNIRTVCGRISAFYREVLANGTPASPPPAARPAPTARAATRPTTTAARTASTPPIPPPLWAARPTPPIPPPPPVQATTTEDRSTTGNAQFNRGNGSAASTFLNSSGGTIWSWGTNHHGQLGDGSRESRRTPSAIQAIANVRQVIAGYECALAVRDDGTVYAWGDNDFGKLGDGTEDERLSPVQVRDLTGVTMVAAGARTSYALKDDGTVWAWGGNPFHELGAGPDLDWQTPRNQSDAIAYRAMNNAERGRPTPVRVHGLTNIVTVAAGGARAFALRSDGTVWAWGDNQRGRLGDGTTTEHLTPIRVLGLVEVVAIAVGESSSYALKADGSVWAWGGNRWGQLGDGTVDDRFLPVQVRGLRDVAALAAGYSSAYALGSDGAVWAWGNNHHGQLGGGTVLDRSTPTLVVGLQGATEIAAGTTSAYALVDGSTVWAWGSNEYGQLCDSDRADRLVPAQVPGFHGIASISARKDTVFALAEGSGPGTGYTEYKPTNVSSPHAKVSESGAVWAWGSNYLAGLGDGTRADRLMPVPVCKLTDVKEVTVPGRPGWANDGFTRALKTDGTVWAWGGQMVNNTLDGNLEPEQVNLSSVVAITDGFALKSDGSLWDIRVLLSAKCPAQVPGATDVRAFFSLEPLLYVVKSDDSVWVCELSHYAWAQKGEYHWGGKERQLDGLSAVTSIRSRNEEGGRRFDVALTEDGTVWEWRVKPLDAGVPNQAMNKYKAVEAPVQVPGLTSVAAISSGTSCCYALNSDGTVWAWGNNESGQLGDGTEEGRSMPAMVDTLTDVVAVDPLGDTCFALKGDGTVWAWGDNEEGQLGDGTQDTRTRPVQIPELVGVKALRGGFAIKGDGTVWAWGDNRDGRLADGTKACRATPRQIDGIGGIGNMASAQSSWYAIASNSLS